MKYVNKLNKIQSVYMEQIGSGKNNKKTKEKKCLVNKINDTDIVLFGNGGSNAIILISKNKMAYKIFVNYFFNLNKDIEHKIKI